MKGRGGVRYGGYQGWLTAAGVSKFFADRACGVTAACNMLAYLSRRPGMEGLWPHDLTANGFNAAQKELYGYLKPRPWGIFTVGKLIRGVERYARDRGVPLRAVRRGRIAMQDYIADGLSRDCPVLLLTWNTPIRELRFHWVTATRLYDGGDGVKVVTSNWAKRKEYDFRAWMEGRSLHRGAVWFEQPAAKIFSNSRFTTGENSAILRERPEKTRP